MAVLQQGQRLGQYAIEGLLGRGQENEVYIRDEGLSRRHAQIEFRDGGYWLTDLGSTNGTFVNGTKLTAPRRLQAGDAIRAARTGMTVILRTGDDPVIGGR